MSFQYVSKNSFQLSRSSQSFSRLIRLQRVGIGGSKCVVIGVFARLSHFTDNTSAFTRFFQDFQSFCRTRRAQPQSVSAKSAGVNNAKLFPASMKELEKVSRCLR